MTVEEFEAMYATNSKVSVAELRARRTPLPCGCGGDWCHGWAMVPRELVEDHMKFYAPKDEA